MKLTKEELRSIENYLSDVGQRLGRANDMHRLNVAYGKPHGMSETTWKMRIREEADHLQAQWEMWRELKKRYGL